MQHNPTTLELINQRERQLLVHSYLYYQLNTNIIDDFKFDRWSKELVELMREHPEEFSKSAYAAAFKDFDGSSGYNLPYSLPEIQNVGNRLLQYEKKRRTMDGLEK